METAKSYWDGYYDKKNQQEKLSPSPFLTSMLPRLQKGDALDIAMGKGDNAVFLAKNGFNVTGFDISSKAIEKAKSLAKKEEVSLDISSCDLDMYLMGVLKYDTVIMTMFKPSVPRYYAAIQSALKQGGVFLLESYNLSQMKEPIAKKESYKDIYFGSNEVLRHLSGLKILFYQEGLVEGSHMVQCLAQKPIDRHAAKFDTFGIHTAGARKDKDSAAHHLQMAENFFKS